MEMKTTYTETPDLPEEVKKLDTKVKEDLTTASKQHGRQIEQFMEEVCQENGIDLATVHDRGQVEFCKEDGSYLFSFEGKPLAYLGPVKIGTVGNKLNITQEVRKLY